VDPRTRCIDNAHGTARLVTPNSRDSGRSRLAAVSTPFLKDEHADLQQILLYNLDGRELPD
jgi:hypothetical protein